MSGAWAKLMLAGVLGLACALGSGCRIVERPEPRLMGPQTPPPVGEPVPTEKEKTTLPPYIIEPPDILTIEVLRLAPKPPYRLQPTDVLQVEIDGLTEPYLKNLLIDLSGNIKLGAKLGEPIPVAGLTVEQATDAVREKLLENFSEPEVSITLLQAGALQPISAEHLVSPDGTVNLGTYGSVYVAGMTLDEAKEAVEAKLAEKLDHPQVALSIFAYNSKVYYVISQGAGFGDNVARLPITGNETVLDAISQINGTTRLSSKRIWIARPAPGGAGCEVILPVDWREITAGAGTATCYQVLPGDRIFIAENKLIALDSMLNKAIAPFERVFGFTLLGTQTIQTINRFPLGISGLGSGF